MKKQVLIMVAFFISCNLMAQQNSVTDTLLNKQLPFISITNLRVSTLSKKNYLFSLNADFPRYYKVLNAKSGTFDKVSDKVVLNEAYFNLYFTYGFSDKLNFSFDLPVTDIHHYSPMLFVSGKGIGDVKIGANYNLLKSDSDRNSLTAGLDIGFPTGKNSNLSPADFPLGYGAFLFRGTLAGFHKINTQKIIYAAYYELRTNNSSNVDIGDELGAYLYLQKPFNSNYGRFSIEYGFYNYLKMSDNLNSTDVKNSSDWAVNLFLGAQYEYSKNFSLQFGIPYSIIQNNAFMTKYRVMVQLNYFINKNK